MEISERITMRRKELGLTKLALAKTLGLSGVSILKWENGQNEPSGKNLFALSDALKCSPAWLLFGDEDKSPTPVDELPTELDEQQTQLLSLFNQLPDSEKTILINEISARVENFNKLFEELLRVRKQRK
ncbi:helix-turn-helix domain-containing protein [Escherichia coli]|uniref:Helix-turn-helix domain-containing protein n=1 Tax=Escherichia coli TaxID=562 RepID=A0AAI9BBI4_ECOLX|nr:helix-turn-helix domain-containing protein [Escherichia coli]ELW2702627.1 helix-turn-helix domain-containing protein [Escherichia coli O26]HDQ6536929.1 helix-turn-helix domain-containing protein [Escherichia coli O36:H14]HDQ6571366.1 helix-turn-helix domain-containing protein [Escherichia coli Ou:H7]HDQ6587149.1 helix-turn-helix domain-containing protein [Escherichia coli O187:H28]ANO90443.1 transcriptional regulator [Escherichia coli]